MIISLLDTSGGERDITEQIFQYEEAVLFIVQDYLNKNKYFTVDDIIPHINSRLRELSITLNFSGIKEVLKSLIKKKLIFERSKLSENPAIIAIKIINIAVLCGLGARNTYDVTLVVRTMERSIELDCDPLIELPKTCDDFFENRFCLMASPWVSILLNLLYFVM